jgi:hypothetical protein
LAEVNSNPDRALDSWKEIAVFLHRGVRTVQRWERTEGLPVRRHHHMKRGSVFALASELAAWQQARQRGARRSVRKAVVLPSTPVFMEQLVRLGNLTRQQAALVEEGKKLSAVYARIEDFFTESVFTESVFTESVFTESVFTESVFTESVLNGRD